MTGDGVGKRIQLTVAPGKVVERLTAEQVDELCRAWVAAYPADRHGINVTAYAWHVFSFERYPSISGDEALGEYEKNEATEYLVLVDDEREGLITDQRPMKASATDYIVCPRNWAWTMAFTHEDGSLGPYFARHRDYEVLQGENRKAVTDMTHKRQQMERAKKKGWA